MTARVLHRSFHPLPAALALSLLLAPLALLWAPRAAAFEALDGRIQAHGYFEMQLRVMSRNFSDQWDMTQWYNIFNLELELDLVRDTHGPIDLVSAYMRIEARFDCVYSRGCGMIKGVDVYGNRARRMPRRLNNADEYLSTGQIPISNEGPFANEDNDPLRVEQVPGFAGIYDGNEEGAGPVDARGLMQCDNDAGCDPATSRKLVPFGVDPRFWQADRNRRAMKDGEAIDDGTNGAPYLLVMQEYNDFRFAAIPVIGGANDGHALMLMGPWLPENFIEPNGSGARIVNPFDHQRVGPPSLSPGGTPMGGNGMRPIALFDEDDPERARIWIKPTTTIVGNPLPPEQQVGRWEIINPALLNQRAYLNRPGEGTEARGIYIPSMPLRRALEEDKFGEFNFNYSEQERAFNRGASQDDEGELKEAYLDIEMFDSRLWLRVGKQSIVWGKTELFRTTDQFNPQDFALATLPNLEESRINLWALRGVWSFYEVGPFSDVRLELAMNFDQYESADLGACGEPYTINVVCQLTFGSWVHGFTGIGVAGRETPPDPWNDSRGIEFGGRLEFRWDRFSFAIADFYGFDDFPYPVQLTSYSRNVDWRSGRPRIYMGTPEELSLLGAGGRGCATPTGMGLVFPDDGNGNPDFTQEANAVGTRISFDGAENSGCLTPGPTNRRVTIIEDDQGRFPTTGAPWRNPVLPRNNQGAILSGFNQNRYINYEGIFQQDIARADPDAQQPVFSTAQVENPTSRQDWLPGPHNDLYLCGSLTNPDDPSDTSWVPWQPQPGYSASEGGPCPDRPVGQTAIENYDPQDGRRRYDPNKYDPASGLLNPNYNPFYDPRYDRHFDVSRVIRRGPSGDFAFGYHTDPGDVIATSPVLYDPFQASAEFDTTPVEECPDQDPEECPGQGATLGRKLWGNAYDPNLFYDERNALDMAPVNQSVYAWVCSTTIGFNELDTSACAQTVFGSSREASDASAARISAVISGFLSGNSLFVSFLGSTPSDNILSKGPALPQFMGPLLINLHADYASDAVPIAQGLNSYRTWDQRRFWWSQSLSPYIYSREQESYNCVHTFSEALSTGAVQLCGGLAINTPNPFEPLPPAETRIRSGSYLSRVFSPEQEALIGCGPYFLTSCDSNGLDLLWAEGSALLQSFIGADSRGIAFADLGLTGLVYEIFGDRLMDQGSDQLEYRTDGGVIGIDGELIRSDANGNPVLGTSGTAGIAGYLAMGKDGNPCDYSNIDGDTFLTGTGGEWDEQVDRDTPSSAANNRWNPRCLDDRPIFKVYGAQPGTAAFEILGLGGPKCTTADIGGPVGLAGQLPGCRNKWATLLYRPTDAWTPEMGLGPNVREAGYVGNFRFSDQVLANGAPRLDPTAFASPRRDYRQYTDSEGRQLAQIRVDTAFGPLPCGDGIAGVDNIDPDDPQNYDCFVKRPSLGHATAGARASVPWDSAYEVAPGDPRLVQAQLSEGSGLNWGTYWVDYNETYAEARGVDGRPYGAVAMPENCSGSPDDPNCYLGGWQQGVDGDPDFLGLIDGNETIHYPEARDDASSIPYFYDSDWADDQGVLTWVQGVLQQPSRIETGCTSADKAVFLQRRLIDGQSELITPTQCVHTFFARDAEEGNGSGHPFTGESFASEMAGMSFSFMMLLVGFSDEFQDGLASVRAYVNPELYERRYIWDEPWMWDPDCATNGGCGGPQDRYIADYGNPNKELDAVTDRVRQVTGFQWIGMGSLTDGTRVAINPLPEGQANRLQRDPSTRNILTDFPDLLLHECETARNLRDPDLRHCTTANDWDAVAQAQRLGKLEQRQFFNTTLGNGLHRSMLWDYAFTGSENDIMAMIPYCEDLEFTQKHTQTKNNTSQPIYPGDSFSYSNISSTVNQLAGPRRVDCSEGTAGRVLGRERCTFVTPQHCDLVRALFSVAGQERNVLRAGGLNGFGRRTMQWQSGGEVYLSYEKRNVLGFSMDFAEDTTKSNWSVEFTWIEGNPRIDNNSFTGITRTDDFNLTVSVDRPTFINFLNANRTFFINSQWFFQYRNGWNDGMPNNGPFNVLATLAVFTGYFQDRLNPQMVFVFDFMSSSGAMLPQVGYRFNERFSITLGASLFWGSQQLVNMPVNGVAPGQNRSGAAAYQDSFQPGLSIVRDRDEVWMNLRYTF